MTTVENRFDTKWVVSSQTSRKYRGNRQDFTKDGLGTTSTLATQVAINEGVYGGEDTGMMIYTLS